MKSLEDKRDLFLKGIKKFENYIDEGLEKLSPLYKTRKEFLLEDDSLLGKKELDSKGMALKFVNYMIDNYESEIKRINQDVKDLGKYVEKINELILMKLEI